MSRAVQLKEEGNRRFQATDYAAADSLYSQAIILDPKSPALYTNRAMARIKMRNWASAIADCNACLTLAPANLKAFFYLAQAQVEIGDHDAAVESAMRAHALCAATNDRSLAAATSMVLRCKKERWEGRERRRAREAKDLERELLELLAGKRDELLASGGGGGGGGGVDVIGVCAEADAKAALLGDVFDRARAQSSDAARSVPDWAIDDISFGILVDPVITKTGKSYERASIMEHLRRHASDPLTREPLQASELRPNLALRQACEEFVDKNGWAVDW